MEQSQIIKMFHIIFFGGELDMFFLIFSFCRCEMEIKCTKTYLIGNTPVFISEKLIPTDILCINSTSDNMGVIFNRCMAIMAKAYIDKGGNITSYGPYYVFRQLLGGLYFSRPNSSVILMIHDVNFEEINVTISAFHFPKDCQSRIFSNRLHDTIQLNWEKRPNNGTIYQNQTFCYFNGAASDRNYVISMFTHANEANLSFYRNHTDIVRYTGKADIIRKVKKDEPEMMVFRTGTYVKDNRLTANINALGHYAVVFIKKNLSSNVSDIVPVYGTLNPIDIQNWQFVLGIVCAIFFLLILIILSCFCFASFLQFCNCCNLSRLFYPIERIAETDDPATDDTIIQLLHPNAAQIRQYQHELQSTANNQA